jgi:hypothetical protein
MQGSADAMMADALDKSHTCIICISKKYKESPNCMQEGKYANQRRKRGKLNIQFLMMDSNYTTSSEESPDGWLGMMLGDAIWNPCWDEGCMDGCVKAMDANLTGQAESAKVAPVAAPKREGAPPTVAPSAAAGNKDKAWEFLQNPKKCVDVEAVKAKLDDLGVETAEELVESDEADLRSIAALLKKVPAKIFLAAFNLTPE